MNLLKKAAEKWRKADGMRGYVCDCCGAELFLYPQERICADCEKQLQRNNGRTCEKCGRKTVAEGVCMVCKSELPHFTKGISPFAYEKETPSLINRLKNGKRRLAWFLGEEMAKELLKVCPRFCERELLVLPVPTTKETERERGYNQAQALAETVTDYLRRQGVNAETDGDILQKRKETRQQKRLGFRERAENVSGAYHVHKRAECKDKTVLLIDDVMTTGATGNECASRLFGAGAKEVFFLVAASLPERL